MATLEAPRRNRSLAAWPASSPKWLQADHYQYPAFQVLGGRAEDRLKGKSEVAVGASEGDGLGSKTSGCSRRNS